MIVFRILWRTIVATIGFLVAGLAAVAVILAARGVLALPVDLPGWVGAPRGPAGGEELRRIFDVARFGLLYVFTLSAVAAPGLIVVLLSEMLAIRYLAFHVAAGAGLAVWAMRTHLGALPDSAMPALVAAGLVGGFVYWLVAGRGAGLAARTPARPTTVPLGKPPHPPGPGVPPSGTAHPLPSPTARPRQPVVDRKPR